MTPAYRRVLAALELVAEGWTLSSAVAECDVSEGHTYRLLERHEELRHALGAARALARKHRFRHGLQTLGDYATDEQRLRQDTNAVCSEVAYGVTLAAACRRVGVRPEVFRQLRRRQPQVARAVRRAQAVGRGTQ